MTTLQVVNQANEDQLATGANDIDLEVRLRNQVIPKFEMDVGQVAWRRRTATINLQVGVRTYDLPTDFDEILELPFLTGGSGGTSEVVYVGENASKISASEADTVQGRPDGYWVTRNSSAPNLMRRISFTKLPDAAYVFRYGYLWTLEFVDSTTTVDLDNFIPRKLQWALVERLRAELLRSRVGIGDPRFVAAMQSYQEYVNDAIDLKEPGRRNNLKRVGQAPA
jgi:hypothetical protein